MYARPRRREDSHSSNSTKKTGKFTGKIRYYLASTLTGMENPDAHAATPYEMENQYAGTVLDGTSCLALLPTK